MLKRSTSFAAGVVDAAVRAAAAFEQARASRAETAPTPPDEGALNVLEGRMVLEFGALLDVVNDAREEGLGIAALEIGPALHRALLQRPGEARHEASGEARRAHGEAFTAHLQPPTAPLQPPTAHLQRYWLPVRPRRGRAPAPGRSAAPRHAA